eukprot:2611842-Ditylum_brightwellii.AAC.1
MVSTKRSREKLDPGLPKPLFKELDKNIFCNADHDHNKKTRLLATGLFFCIGLTSVLWVSKQQ